MRTPTRPLLLALALAAPAVAREPAPPPAGSPWPAGPVVAGRVTIPYGLRLAGEQKPEAVRALVKKLAARRLPGVVLFDLGGKTPPPPPPALGIFQVEPEPLRPEALRYFGRGLDAAAQQRLLTPLPVTGLVLFAEGPKAAAMLRAMAGLVSDAATELGATVDDAEARLHYGARAFAESVVRDGFEGDLPVVMRHVALHSYALEDGSIRSVTVGMSKLGLPDLVVLSPGQHGGSSLQSLVGVVAQTLAERGRLATSGRIEIDLAALRARAVREAELASLKKGARRKVVLVASVGKREQGDAENPLLELTFGGAGSIAERQMASLAELYGREDAVVGVRHDDRLRAESARARARLLALKPGWQKGRAAGEQLMVKAPFRTRSGADEYMWVEVKEWSGPRIRGLLANEPMDVPGLRPGAQVEVEEAKVFDYTLRRDDGTVEGNTTARLLQGG